MLTAIATGKLFVVLPQISQRAEQLLHVEGESDKAIEDSTASILVPLAYPFPHIGKILTFLFVSFAAWYVGDDLGPVATAEMSMMLVLWMVSRTAFGNWEPMSWMPQGKHVSGIRRSSLKWWIRFKHSLKGNVRILTG